jgi:hypothetical protein
MFPIFVDLAIRGGLKPKPRGQYTVSKCRYLTLIARTLMPLTGCGVIDSEQRLTPTRALSLRCRLASAKMRSVYLLCTDLG